MASRYASRSPVDELLRMADNVEQISITALSSGIGLGTPRPVFKVRSDSTAYVAKVSVPDTPWQAADHLTEAAFDTSDVTEPATKKKAKKFVMPRPNIPAAWRGLVLAHLADLIVVSVSLLAAFAVASVFFAPLNTMAKPSVLLQWEPVKFVLEMSAWQTVAALYGIFAMYWLVFRLVVGATLGQNLSESLRNSRRHPSA